MEAGLREWLNRIEGKIDSVAEKVDKQPCKVHTEQLKMLMRVVYGVIGVILTVWVLNTTGRDSIATKETKEAAKVTKGNVTIHVERDEE